MSDANCLRQTCRQTGRAPVKLAVEFNYYVERPDAFAPKWMIGMNITPVVQNFVEGWLKGQ